MLTFNYSPILLVLFLCGVQFLIARIPLRQFKLWLVCYLLWLAIITAVFLIWGLGAYLRDGQAVSSAAAVIGSWSIFSLGPVLVRTLDVFVRRAMIRQFKRWLRERNRFRPNSTDHNELAKWENDVQILEQNGTVDVKEMWLRLDQLKRLYTGRLLKANKVLGNLRELYSRTNSIDMKSWRSLFAIGLPLFCNVLVFAYYLGNVEASLEFRKLTSSAMYSQTQPSKQLKLLFTDGSARLTWEMENGIAAFVYYNPSSDLAIRIPQSSVPTMNALKVNLQSIKPTTATSPSAATAP